MTFKDYIQEKLTLVFQALEGLPSENLSSEDWVELRLAKDTLRLGALNTKLRSLMSTEIHKTNYNHRAATTFFVACLRVKNCLDEARSAAIVYCSEAKIQEGEKDDLGDILPLSNLIKAILMENPKMVKTRLARLKKRRPDLIPLYLGPAEDALSCWLS